MNSFRNVEWKPKGVRWLRTVWLQSPSWQEERLFCSASCFLLKRCIPMKTLHTPAGEDNEIGVCNMDSIAHLNANLLFISCSSHDVSLGH